ncbi:MAG: hypothetical protein KY476_04385 [Planctomycetes bacterium]|nr:hypothetical protein [Planctomycetota bacterium]
MKAHRKFPPRRRCGQRDEAALRARRGFTLFELAVTTLVLGAAFALIGPLLVRVARSERAAEQRQIALFEVSNTLERITSLDWQSLTGESLDSLPLSETARAGLSEPNLRASVEAVKGPPEAKRIVVEIDWKDTAGVRVAPVRLVTEVYRRESGLGSGP